MNVNEASAREALKVWQQEHAWIMWLGSPEGTPEPELPAPEIRSKATKILAQFAAKILERNP